MANYGYARVSTIDQDLTIQEQALKNGKAPGLGWASGGFAPHTSLRLVTGS